MTSAEPHAYYVEARWNRGTSTEHWAREMDAAQRRTREQAEEDRREYIADMFAPEDVRVVGVVVLDPS